MEHLVHGLPRLGHLDAQLAHGGLALARLARRHLELLDVLLDAQLVARHALLRLVALHRESAVHNRLTFSTRTRRSTPKSAIRLPRIY